MKNSLDKYNKKRDFSKTKEPEAVIPHEAPAELRDPINASKNTGEIPERDANAPVRDDRQVFRFVIQKHHATALHYDFRIEHGGVLKSWAVPKGLPYKNSEKHLAMQVEDHPLDYFSFEGIIPEGNYGAGSVIVWDFGNYWVPHAKDEKEVVEFIERGFEKGEIKLILNGKKVKGLFALVQFKKAGENAWLAIKDKDEFEGHDFTNEDKSVKSGKTLKQVEEKENESTLDFIQPMLATLGKIPFDNPDYIFEEKLDGYRTIAVVNHDKVELYSRKGEKTNHKFPEIVKSLQALKFQCILDGEIVAYNGKGKAEFQLIQNHESAKNLVYHAFDILNLNGISTLDLPLLQRKKFLKKAIPKDKKNLQVTKFVLEKGKQLFKNTKNKSEGIIAKKIDSRYLPGERSTEWIKIKNQLREEFVIGGVTWPQGSQIGFGSLIVGYYKNKKLTFCGHIGTGFSTELIKTLMSNLQKIKRKSSPFVNYKNDKSVQFWVEPIIVCEATFAGWTNDDMIRQASFVGIRTDKLPKQATNESLMLESILSHPDKVFFPQRKLTKLDLAKYYFEIAPILLPYLKDRPQNLNRFPDGIKGKSFYHKDIEFELPEYVETVDIKRDDPKLDPRDKDIDKETTYILCQNVESLIYMANLGCIEINPWLSNINSLDRPDFLVIDIDPNEVEFKLVVETARSLYEFLQEIGIKPFIKTSGKRGIHLYANLGQKYSYEESRGFVELVGKIFERKFSKIISMERSPKDREGKIYIDYLQNRKGQTTAAIYSARPTEFASVSTPIHFEELNKKLDPTSFTIKNTLDRVQKYGDLWEEIWRSKINLGKAIDNLKKEMEKFEL